MSAEDERPLLPSGCWQVPLVLFAGFILFRMVDRPWLPIAIAAFLVLALDIAFAVRRGETLSRRLSVRRWHYLLIGAVGIGALVRALSI
jgi:hypothetical protein